MPPAGSSIDTPVTPAFATAIQEVRSAVIIMAGNLLLFHPNGHPSGRDPERACSVGDGHHFFRAPLEVPHDLDEAPDRGPGRAEAHRQQSTLGARIRHDGGKAFAPE